MSDELMDGRSLRGSGRRPPEEDDSPAEEASQQPPDDRPRRVDEKWQRLLEDDPFALDPGTGTHPYVVLEPPDEAGDVIRQQMADVTRPGDLPPVPLDIAPPEPPPAEPPRAEPPPQPIMKLPRVPVEEVEEATGKEEAPATPPEAEAAPEPPPVSPPMPPSADDAALGGHTPSVLRPIEEDGQPAPPPDDGIPAPLIRISGTRQRATPSRGMAPDSGAAQAATRLSIEGQTEEIVDADWVLEVGGRMRQPLPRAAAGEEPSTLVRALRRSSRWLLPLVALALIVSAAIFVPRSLPSLPSGIGQPGGESGPATVTASALTAQARAWTPTPIPPTSTPLPPFAQGRIAFASNAAGPDYDLYVLDMATGSQRALTADTFNDRTPAWSPDGQYIVFVSDRGGSDDLWVVEAEGGVAVRVTSSPEADHFPAWSPDAATILFSRESATGSNLIALPTACLAQPATCEGLLRLITDQRYDRTPAWAPGGGQIAFAAGTVAGEPTVIALLNIDGSAYTPLAGTGSSDFAPAWSPDGLRIAFASYARGDQDLWVMSRTGENLVQLTRGAATDVGPSWSPDGTYLVFASDRGEGGSFDLYAMRTDCASPEEGCEDDALRLTDDPADELDPAWAR